MTGVDRSFVVVRSLVCEIVATCGCRAGAAAAARAGTLSQRLQLQLLLKLSQLTLPQLPPCQPTVSQLGQPQPMLSRSALPACSSESPYHL